MPIKGEVGYEVEWYPLNPRNLKICKNEDGDYSQMDCEFRILSDLELARKLAMKHAEKSVFASAMIRKVVFNQYHLWERADDELEEITA